MHTMETLSLRIHTKCHALGGVSLTHTSAFSLMLIRPLPVFSHLLEKLVMVNLVITMYYR